MPHGKLVPYHRGDEKRTPDQPRGARVPYLFLDRKGRFVISVERAGKRRRRLCRNRTEATYLSENINQLFEGTDEQKDFLLLSDLIERYERESEAHVVAPETHRAQERNLMRILKNPRIEDIRPNLAPGYLMERLEDGVGPKAANDDLRRLHRLLNLAVRDGILEKNPFSGWRKLKEPAPRTRWLTREEEARLMAECDEEFGRLIQIALLSGMRQGEQLTCRADQILWESNLIYLPRTKNGDARHVPMNDRLCELVKAQLALDTEWLCPNRARKNRWLKDNLRRRFNTVCERAKIENFTWHDLRHTFCSRLAMAGTPLRTIQVLAGHRSISTTERYAHLSSEHLAQAVRVLD